MAQEVRFENMLYGGDYNPEQWLNQPEILDQDLALMKQAHINTVTLGVFSWSTLEPTEGEYNFTWLEEMIDKLYANGIYTILATPSAARPKWLSDRYPEVLRVDEDRTKRLFGLRHNHCYTSPVYREKTRAINMELAKRFGNHPAVLLWHISNELGGECHCPLCQKAFQGWLEKRYTKIEALNKAWNTTFWSHDYQSFAQVESPSSIGENCLHGLTLDWKRFVTDQTVDFVKAEIQALRDAGTTKPTTINMMYYFQGLDYTKFADVVDIASWDSYPTWHKEPEKLTATDNGMYHDWMRSLFHKPFLLMESCPSSTNWQSVSKLKKPGMLEAASYQALAHGSDSVLYFQIRQSRGASEKFHGAVIDHYGKADTRVFGEVEKIGANLEKLQEVIGTKTEAKTAIIYDLENIWAMQDAAGPRNKNLYIKETTMKIYSALRKNGQDVDLISAKEPLDSYKLVIAPMLYMFHDGFTERAKAYVKQGGKLVMTYWSGVVDETDLCFLGGAPYGLLDVLGLRREEIDGLYDGEENGAAPVAGNSFGWEKSYTCNNLCELVKVSTAEVVATYTQDFYAGMPALTRNVYGAGEAWYVCADMEQAFYDDYISRMLAETGICSVFGKEQLPEGIEVNTRENDTHKYVFIQNFGKDTVDMKLPFACEMLMGNQKEPMKQYDTWICKIVK